MAIGTKVDFKKLILKPVVTSKAVRISFNHFACDSPPLTMIKVSSAYWRTGQG
jgi:5-methylcytosine-specific restriction endonuclease McrBC regulatory subunit McrC